MAAKKRNLVNSNGKGNSTNNKNDSNQIVLTSAPPSPQVIVFMGVVFACCWYNLPSKQAYLQTATIENLTTSNISDDNYLGIMRAVFALVIFATQTFVYFGPGWEEIISYPEGSKLKPCKIWMSKNYTLLFFTVWSWLMLGVYFASSAFLSFSDKLLISSDLCRYVLIAWEIAAPNALLVSVVITFVIWPEMNQKGVDTSGLAKPTVLMQHNLNSMMVVMELFVGNTPLTFSHAAVAPIFGLCYVAFSWLIANHISPKDGPVYLYFFFDSTQGPKFGVIAHAALLTCLALFYALAVGLDAALNLATDQNVPFLLQVVVLIVLTYSICKFKA